jgi:sugar phosphate isomerase/epimerase
MLRSTAKSLLRIALSGWLLAWALWPPLAADQSASEAEPPVSDEVLEKWTPGGNRNDPALPYPQITEPFQLETDADWCDSRWQRTAKGPAVSHSILLPDYEVGPKQTAVDVGHGTWLLYDLEAGTFVAAVTGGELRTDEARFGMLNRPWLTGDVAYYVPAVGVWRQGRADAAIAPAKIDHQGRYLHDDRVLMATTIDGVEMWESPAHASTDGVVIRELAVGPLEQPLWLAVASGDRIEVTDDGRSATWRDRQGRKQVVQVAGAAAGVRLVRDASAILLHWPSRDVRSAARLRYVPGGRTSADDPHSHDDDARIDAETDASEPDLARLKEPGAKRWGEPLVVAGTLDGETDRPFAVDRITPPRENEFGALFYLAGLDFFSNGDAAVCTVHGDVWIVRGLDAELKRVTWQRFATGLYQPLGLEVVDDRVIVLGRDQLTRLHDANGDGEADYYESFNHDLIIQGLPHAYAMRLQRIPEGDFVFLKSGPGPHGSSLLKLSADGQRLEVMARGFRHPFGLGVGPDGEITVADNEGNWVPSSKIDLIMPGGFYGYMGDATDAAAGPKPRRPLCFLPKAVDNSSGGQFWHTSDRWGPYHRQGMFHFSWGRCTLHAVLPQDVAGTRQAATVPLPGIRLESGPGEAEFSPRDGQLYVVGLDGWQTAAKADGSFERIRYTGRPVRLPSQFAAYEDGVELAFDVPIDPASFDRADAVRVEWWNYERSAVYGSYHYSPQQPERVGHDILETEGVELSPDGRTVFIRAPLRPVDQIQIALNLTAATGEVIKTTVSATINALAKRSTTLPAEVSVAQIAAAENLVAWCVVPFDAKHRGPEERAAMLHRLGIRRVAYDWRDEHVKQFDEELDAYQRHGIELHAFWAPVNTPAPLDEPHWQTILDLVERRQVQPELWVMLNDGLVASLPADERTARAATILAPAARAAGKLGCRIGLYNHGGWFGEPDNQIQIIHALREQDIHNVGIVYNFHHGHPHMATFADLAKQMAPYLMTVNVNGMRVDGPKIVSFGQGDDAGAAERRMVAALVDAGYDGPLGILGHREDRDAEECLREGLEGLARSFPP